MTNKKYASPPFIKTVELASIIQIEMLQEHVAGWLDDRSVEHSSLCNFQLLFWQEGIGWYSVLLLSDEGNLWSMMPKLVISSGTCSSGLQGMSQGSELPSNQIVIDITVVSWDMFLLMYVSLLGYDLLESHSNP